MNHNTVHASAVLLWIDDDLARMDGWRKEAETPGALWSRIFPERPSRLFGLMEIAIDVAGSLDEAMQAIEFWTGPERAGTHVFAIVDLCIPRQPGGEPDMACGIRCAEELHNRHVEFVFLSSNARARDNLEAVQMGAVPYHVKEKRDDRWRLPDTLAATVLREFANRIGWLNLEHVFERLSPESILGRNRNDKGGLTLQQMTLGGLRSSQDPADRAFFNYPYFSVFRDLVDRWAQRPRTELPGQFVIRASANDCDEFVQQSVLIMLHDWFVNKPKIIRFWYGVVSDRDTAQSLLPPNVLGDPDSVCVLRISPEWTSAECVRQLVVDLQDRIGTTIFVLPDDETAKDFADRMSELHVPTIEELPHIRRGDTAAREEIARNACGLVFVSSPTRASHVAPLTLRGAWLAFPQLLIDPVYWMALLEAEEVATRLSDPFEVVAELHAAVHALSQEQIDAILTAVNKGEPVGYEHLLRVGEEALRSSELGTTQVQWHERALDMWLTTSWQFPYGLRQSFVEQVQLPASGETNGHNAAPHDWSAWEDHAYAVLANLCARHEVVCGHIDARTDLGRVSRFVRNLNGTAFLRKDGPAVDWESLESLRWPHHRYPMPIAVSRRLRAQGRHLWIQPEGLDLAAALPTGRMLYRGLGDIASYYSEVMAWLEDIVPFLPHGWRESVGYLASTLRNHNVSNEWPSDEAGNEAERTQAAASRARFWRHLFGLLANGAPVMFIAERTLLGAPLAGKDGAREYLEDVDGYGKLLARIRSHCSDRVGGRLRPRWGARGRSFLEDAQHDVHVVEALRAAAGTRADARNAELRKAVDALVGALCVLLEQDNIDNDRDTLGDTLQSVLAAPELKLFGNDGWYRESLDGLPDESPHAKIPSLLGMKIDHLMKMLDVHTRLGQMLFPYRGFDGYLLMASIWDVRNVYKGSTPPVGLPTINTIMELFLAGIQGVIAHLAWCLEIAGHTERAARIRPPLLDIVVPGDLERPSAKDLATVLQVKDDASGFRVFTLGIPGGDSAAKLCYHHPDLGVHALEKPSRNNRFAATMEVIIDKNDFVFRP